MLTIVLVYGAFVVTQPDAVTNVILEAARAGVAR